MSIEISDKGVNYHFKEEKPRGMPSDATTGSVSISDIPGLPPLPNDPGYCCDITIVIWIPQTHGWIAFDYHHSYETCNSVDEDYHGPYYIPEDSSDSAIIKDAMAKQKQKDDGSFRVDIYGAREQAKK